MKGDSYQKLWLVAMTCFVGSVLINMHRTLKVLLVLLSLARTDRGVILLELRRQPLHSFALLAFTIPKP